MLINLGKGNHVVWFHLLKINFIKINCEDSHKILSKNFLRAIIPKYKWC